MYLNPRTERADPDETKIVLLDGAKIVDLVSGDMLGNPTGPRVKIAEEVFE